MLAIGRLCAVFLVMVAAAYVVVVIAFPRPIPAGSSPGIESGGRLAAAQLLRQAQFLVGQRPATSMSSTVQ